MMKNIYSKTKIDSFSIFPSHFGLSAPFGQPLSITVNNLELTGCLLWTLHIQIEGKDESLFPNYY